MRQATLQRLKSGPYGTFGVLLGKQKMEAEHPFCVTLEPIVPIPAGTYLCKVYQSPKFEHGVYLLEDVPGHKDIEIHIGNSLKDTTGCILLGDHFGTLVSGEPAVLKSEQTFWYFMRKLRGDDLTLIVVDGEG